MKLHACVVAPDYGNPRCEIGLLARRIAGALAGVARVELLFADVLGREGSLEGVVDARWFPATSPGPRVAGELRALLDEPSADDRGTPFVLREEIHRAQGPDAPGLYERLAEHPPDVLVVLDALAASSYFAFRAVADRSHTILVPLTNPGIPAEGVIASLLASVDRVATLTGAEAELLASANGLVRAPGVLGFFHRLHPLASTTEPWHYDPSKQWCALAAKHEAESSRSLSPFRARQILGGSRFAPAVVTIGARGDDGHRPAAELPSYLAMDDWRWLHCSRLLVDPSASWGVGLLPLEAMLAGRPVIVHEASAAQRHVETADCGLWFRSAPELAAAVDLLLEDHALAATLGENGRRYALDWLGDPDRFTLAVARAVLE